MDNGEPIEVGVSLEDASISSCARCGHSHEITLQKFKKNGVLDFEYWGMCPTLNEPIMVKKYVDGFGSR